MTYDDRGCVIDVGDLCFLGRGAHGSLGARCVEFWCGDLVSHDFLVVGIRQVWLMSRVTPVEVLSVLTSSGQIVDLDRDDVEEMVRTGLVHRLPAGRVL